MSNVKNNSISSINFRQKLLASASAMAVIASIYTVEIARADDSDDKPVVWIELGGQWEQMSAPEQAFIPPFILKTPRPSPETVSPLSIIHPPRASIGGEGKISFEPEGTDWVLSASMRYGRSNNEKHLHQQSYPTQAPQQPISSGEFVPFRKALQFIDAKNQGDEIHAILDFRAGKDVGMGMFGNGSSSLFSLGIRFAQFHSRSNVAFKSDPDAHPTFKYFIGHSFFVGGIYHSNAADATATRSFRGLGPSLSWNASKEIVGNIRDGEVALDWGLNAALLFGRQKASIHHQVTAQYHSGKYSHPAQYPRITLYHHSTNPPARARTVIVPNIGGSLGVSFAYSSVKIDAGYRADMFFGAMDGGIDTRKSENRDFYGPFATISIGIGG
jgi:iron complex outermembrane receptor protein